MRPEPLSLSTITSGAIMSKKLSEMTLEELWQLFPIRLTEHQPVWAAWYAEELLLLQRCLPQAVFHHIGSTAIPGIWAKPFIDILAELPLGLPLQDAIAALTDCGYRCMSRAVERMSFNKGYTESGFAERVFHLHLRYTGDHDEVYFRDYLLAHPDAAREYEQLKLSLWKPYEHDRDGYTQAKTDFVRRITEAAKATNRIAAANSMVTAETYRQNPCRALSIPYWKSKHIRIPQHMHIVHDDEYRTDSYREYHDEPYFRLFHGLKDLRSVPVQGVSIATATPDDMPLLVDVINRSYTDLSVTVEQLESYTRTEAYCPELWIIAYDHVNACVAGCGIADFDPELREGVIEWIQVIPACRGRKIGQLIVNELLKRMANMAAFATVSGKVNNATAPERLYRKCGFVGNDVWHILTRNE